MFGTVSKWIGVYNIWYYGVFMALNGKLAYCMPNLSILPIVAVLTFLILSVVIQANAQPNDILWCVQIFDLIGY